MTRLAPLYSLGLVTWGIVRLAFGDSTAFLFAVNALAMYLFLPMPLVTGLAVLSRRRLHLLAAFAAALIFAYWWGGQLLTLLPRSHAAAAAGDTRIRVMTFNVFGHNHHSDDVVKVIRDSNADIVSLVELNLKNGAAITTDLAAEYPHQLLEAKSGTTGAGLISRYPLTALDASALDDPDWVGRPIVAAIKIGDRSLTYVCFHVPAMPGRHHSRDRQAAKLAAFARGIDGPVIVAGDLNATATNTAYSTLTHDLKDAWREAGIGLGHTFPTSTVPGRTHATIHGIAVPDWLLRIDFIFHTRHLHATSAETAPPAGSDHRPVIATLTFVN